MTTDRELLIRFRKWHGAAYKRSAKSARILAELVSDTDIHLQDRRCGTCANNEDGRCMAEVPAWTVSCHAEGYPVNPEFCTKCPCWTKRGTTIKGEPC